jgi:NCS1 family nucleobase:cation symporter-1
MLHSIFPSIARIPNKMGAGSALSSAEMICFFLFCGVTLLACQLSMCV